MRGKVAKKLRRMARALSVGQPWYLPLGVQKRKLFQKKILTFIVHRLNPSCGKLIYRRLKADPKFRGLPLERFEGSPV